MRRYWFPKPYADAVAKLRVPAGFLLGGLFVWLARPSFTSLVVGSAVSAVEPRNPRMGCRTPGEERTASGNRYLMPMSATRCTWGRSLLPPD